MQNDKRKILVVDDNRGERELFARILKKGNYEVQVASNAKEALALIKQHPFDLAIADIYMPNMSGIDLLTALKKRCPQTMGMVVTGFASVETAIEAIRRGAYDYITKPLESKDDILMRVSRAMERKTLGEENDRLFKELKEANRGLALKKARLEQEVVVSERTIEKQDKDLKQAYEELTKAYRELEDSVEEKKRMERLAAMGEFSAKIVHELRSPLTSIGGFVQLLPARYASDTFREKFIETTTREVKRLNALANRLLEFSRPHPLELRQTDVEGMLQSVLERFQNPLEKKKIKVRTRFASSLPKMKLDRSSMEQVIENLVRNAEEAMRGGGTLTVTTRWDPEQQVVRILVADSGTGISRDQLEKIFEPFFTTKAKGTGLGLAICRQIVEQHGGRLSAASSAGKGSEFLVQLAMEKRGGGTFR